MKIFLLLTLSLITKKGLSQTTVDGEFLFKTHLFLNQSIFQKRGKVLNSKSFALFEYFNKNVSLKFDTLESKKFPKKYVFLCINNTKAGSVKINPGVTDADSLAILSSMLECKKIVLCINIRSETAYRLSGFYDNDLLALFHAVKSGIKATENKELRIKSFLKDYAVEGLDFNCIYEGIHSGSFDSDNYPCLKDCRGEVISIP